MQDLRFACRALRKNRGFAVAVAGTLALGIGGVARRTHEIGVRLAMGAERSDIRLIVVWQGFRLALAGIAFRLDGGLRVDAHPQHVFVWS